MERSEDAYLLRDIRTFANVALLALGLCAFAAFAWLMLAAMGNQ